MLRALGISRNAKEHIASSAQDRIVIINESIEVEYALAAMDAVLDGQLDEANTLLDREDSVFNRIATGVLHFIEATVGFEPEAIQQAITSLAASESYASKMKSQAQKTGLITSAFRPGAEYEMAELESSLLGAISMLLTESKIEILKALYRIRKTYLALEELRKHVNNVDKANSKPGDTADISSKSSAESRRNSTTSTEPRTGTDKVAWEKFTSIHNQRTARSSTPTTDITPSDTIEEYLRSGVETMSGLLHLILSSVPPNIARLLSVVGLHGDREVAMDLLWTSSTGYHNIHGSLALIALIMFFDGQLMYKDIKLSQEEEDVISDKYATVKKGKTTAQLTPRELQRTKERLLVALEEQRTYYPHGVLWLLQQGRLVTHDDLARGVRILESDECGPNQMRQVEGLLMFDRTLFLLTLNKLEEAADEFIKLMDVSTWSHPLYMYMAGACYLELYRASDNKESEEAKAYKDKARTYFSRAPKVGGKKKVLGRKMPFDTFVLRKVEAMQKAAAKYGLDVVDAVGPSPVYEALYFWNGPSRMEPETAACCCERLKYSKNALLAESPKDKFTRELLESIYMRRAGMEKEGFEKIQNLVQEVVKGDIANGKKVTYTAQGEPWAGAAALYERAIYEWTEFGQSHAKQVRRWLTLSKDWSEDYELSTRINMKITSAEDRLDIYRL
ncbi:hypothetical protein DASB73_040670 [Starmerella bacillaris]|uniref:Inclusion body clearance protein IML2 n=1 Tax=Starmerella bacillaris TaxID=1247836 RepID=A0AAV5RRE7_STABA|nr:hypothetical protein DASB73_040670 [Starmerella bacillaris]